MQINEIFSSIEGEGIRAGYLATFIRTQFCSLNCTYCDTKYSLTAEDEHGNLQYTDMTIEQILLKCQEFNNRRVTLTGGEPLIQKDAKLLIDTLINNEFQVNIETNGNINISEYRIDSPFYDNLIITMDWKSPSSGMRDKMLLPNLFCLNQNDVLKFVVGTKEDLDDMCKLVKTLRLKCNLFVSPIFGKIQLVDIVNYLKENNLQNIRLQVQLHKIIWDCNTRGV